MSEDARRVGQFTEALPVALLVAVAPAYMGVAHRPAQDLRVCDVFALWLAGAVASAPEVIRFPKPVPHVVARLKKRRKVAYMDRAAKELVRKRDMESCRVCGRKSRGVHERVFKSRGGKASLENSLVLCALCHEYTHGHAIKPHGEDCNGPMFFEMGPEVAQQIFRGMAVPPHVTVVGMMTEENYPPED